MPYSKPPDIVPANTHTELPAPASLQVKITPARSTNVAENAAGSIGSLPSLPSSSCRDNLDFALQTKQLNMQDTLAQDFVTLTKNVTNVVFLRKLDLNFDKAAIVFFHDPISNIICIQSKKFHNGTPYFLLKISADYNVECYHIGTRVNIRLGNENRRRKVKLWSEIGEYLYPFWHINFW